MVAVAIFVPKLVRLLSHSLPFPSRLDEVAPFAMETFFGKKKNRPRQSSITAQDAYERASRPLSHSSLSAPRSESNRLSRYTSSISPTEASHHHLSTLSQHIHKLTTADEFYYPRPEDEEEIEMLFQNIMRMRDLGDMPNLSIDQKWHIVYNDEQIRWKEERQREEQARKQSETGQPAAISEGTPEWYIKKFVDKTVTAKQASSLQVSLRSKELRLVALGQVLPVAFSCLSQLVQTFRVYSRDICAGADPSSHQPQRCAKV